MNKQEAIQIAETQISLLQERGYEELTKYLEPQHEEKRGESGVLYQVETKAVWDGSAGGDLRIFVLVDDKGWRAFMPLSREFIVRPDGSVVGE
jgi:hypothetical protein